MYCYNAALTVLIKLSSGARDWEVVQEELDHKPRIVRFLTFLEDYTPEVVADYLAHLVGKMEATNETWAVYMLTSFIEVR